jgi:hypothetical protein
MRVNMIMKTKPIVLFVGIIMISLVFTCLSYGKIAPASAVGVWLFNEDKGNIAKDASGKGNDGKIKSSPAWVDGKFGKALDFDGVDDYVDIADTDNLSGGNGKKLSVVAWFKTTKIEGTDNTPIITKYLDAGQKDWGFTVDNGKLKFAYETVGAGVDFEVNAPSMGGVVELDKWYHGAFALDGTKVKVYLDGVEVASATMPTETPNTNVNVAIGSVVYRSNYFRGIIDDVGVFNATLSKEDILEIMVNGLESALAVSSMGKLPMTWGEIRTQY